MSKAMTCTMTWPDFVGLLDKRQGEIDLFIAANMQTNRGMMFREEGAYHGHEKWAPLKWRVGQPLRDRGALSQSMGPKNDDKSPGKAPGGIVRISKGAVVIGTDLKYAAMMNWGTTGLPGGVLKPKNKKALAFPGPGGNGTVVVNNVKIPARHFDGWNDQDQENLEDALLEKLKEIMQGG